MTRPLYRLLTDLGGPAIRLYLARRLRRGKEDPDRLGERLGRPTRPRPPGALIWLHAASVGETFSVLALIERLLSERPGTALLVTSGTVSSAGLLAKRLPAGAFHQFVPVDRMAWVRGFLDHWRPDLALWVESEFWPNLIGETQRRGIPMALLNARLSDRSFRRWRRFPGLIRPLLQGFAVTLGQDEAQAARLAALGARQAKAVGNLKFAAAPLPADPAELRQLRQAIGDRPVWLAASTHPGEEAIAAQAHRRLKERHPTLLTVIVPRHATRAPEILAALASFGLRVAQRSRGDVLDGTAEIYLADSMGELGLFYRAIDIAFVGGSLVPIGGHNPIEPAQLDTAVLTGPHIFNFETIYDRMTAAGAASKIADEPALVEALAGLLADRAMRDRQADAAASFATREAGVLDAVLAELAPLLDRIDGNAHARA
jgi:3-deoxy-D-manno-octulosonic-acid transferase